MTKPSFKNIINAAIVILVLVFVYLSYRTATNFGISSFRTETKVVGRELFTTLDKLSTINLDKSVLATVEFQSLVNFRKPIDPERAGRANPFAPVGRDTGGVLVGPDEVIATTTPPIVVPDATSGNATSTGSSLQIA